MASSKAMEQPVIKIYEAYKENKPVQIWLVENVTTRLEGYILGFDEFMNVVLGDAVEVHTGKRTRTPLGRMLLKGDNISLITLQETRE